MLEKIKQQKWCLSSVLCEDLSSVEAAVLWAAGSWPNPTVFHRRYIGNVCGGLPGLRMGRGQSLRAAVAPEKGQHGARFIGDLVVKVERKNRMPNSQGTKGSAAGDMTGHGKSDVSQFCDVLLGVDIF